ncbi:YegP family protein [Fructobacillus fructosus]|uniref:YegP family protein n=1 Tax=Fructobacillus fructosus TaxID=1631 RepID=UPI004033221B
MYFVIRKSIDDQYYFLLKSESGQVVAQSETYLLKSSAEKTIQSIKENVDTGTYVIDSEKL